MPSPAIPAHHEMYAEILAELSTAVGPVVVADLVEPLARRYGLTEDHVAEMYDSGNGPVFADRIQWSLSYLNVGGFMDKPKRGYYTLSEEGRSHVGDANTHIKSIVDERFRERNALRAAAPSTETGGTKSDAGIQVAPSDNRKHQANHV